MYKHHLRIGSFALVAFIFFAVAFFGAVARPARAVTDAVLFQQAGDSTASNGSWYDDNWYQLGRGFAGTITSLTLEGMVDNEQYFASHIQLAEFKDANYTQLANTYLISDDAPFDSSGFKKVTFSGLTIPLDPNHDYRLDTYQDYQNRSVILEGTPGIGTAMSDYFIYGTGRVEDHYVFYPYIVANGNFNEPLVIVPGVMGSELDGAPGAAGGTNAGKEIWPDVTDMANSGSDDYLNALALAPDGTQITVPAPTATSTPDPIFAVDEDGTGATTTVIEPDGADVPPPVHIPPSCTQH